MSDLGRQPPFVRRLSLVLVAANYNRTNLSKYLFCQLVESIDQRHSLEIRVSQREECNDFTKTVAR
jgi:hypothetical protein